MKSAPNPEPEPSLNWLHEDGEIQPGGLAKARRQAGTDLESLMAETGIVELGLRGPRGWKLDQKIEAICRDPDSPTAILLKEKIPSIERYIELLVAIDELNDGKRKFEWSRDLYELAAVLPQGVVALEIMNRLANGETMIGLLAITLFFTWWSSFFRHLKEINLTYQGKKVVEKPLWEQLNRMRAEVKEKEREAAQLYTQILDFFEEAKITWYLRENVFGAALERIVTIYKNNQNTLR